MHIAWLLSIFGIVSVSSVLGILNEPPHYDCRSDYDCNSKETLLFCSNIGQCQCLEGSAPVNGVYLMFSMEWSLQKAKCVSRLGSPCTFTGRWYPSETVKLDCGQDSACVPSAAGTGNTRQYQDNRYQQQQPYNVGGRQDGNTLTYQDFGVCVNRQSFGTGNQAAPQQSPFYPVIVNPNQPNRQQHEFATHQNRYPSSPNRLDNSGTRIGKSALIIGFLFTALVLICI